MDINYVPQSYQKRPISVEALQFTYDTQGIAALHLFCGENLLKTQKAKCIDAKGEAFIQTNRGVLKVIEGSYVIKENEDFYDVDELTFLSEFTKLNKTKIFMMWTNLPSYQNLQN